MVAHHKFFILSKEHFAIYKRKSSVLMALQFQIVSTVLDVAAFCVPVILDAAKIYMVKHTRI